METSGKRITCRAVVCWEAHQPLSVEEVTVDPPRDGEIRVRMVSASICHTDLCCLKGYVYKGFFEGLYPVIPGHEGVGVVESVGPGVSSVKPGDHVLPSFGRQCNKCDACRSLSSNMCVEAIGLGAMLDGTTRVKAKGRDVFQMASLGTFAEYAVLAEMNVAKVNPSVPMEHLSVMGCCVPTGVGAALNGAKVSKGSTCAVWGLGAVGLSVVLGCRMAGASVIVGVDINPDKEADARKFGCTEFVDSSKLGVPVAQYMAERFNGGLDFTFESAGSTTAMSEAFESCRRGGGHCFIIGGVSADQRLTLSPVDFLNDKRISGGLFGLYRFRNDLPALVDMVHEGKIPVDDFYTHSFKLDQINEAMAVMTSGKGIRIAVEINKCP